MADTEAALEVRPPKLVADAMLFVAIGSGLLALLGIATGEVLVGAVALVSAGWLGWLGWLSRAAWSRADDEGITSHWVRTTQSVRWDQMASLEVDRRSHNGVLRSIEAVRVDGAAARWAPWYPFLFYAHSSVSGSLAELERRATAHGVEVMVLTEDPPEPPDE